MSTAGRQRPQVRRDCPMCGGGELYVHFDYHEPPPLETRFPLAQGEKYARQLHRCAQCGHFLEWFELDQSRLYSGEYLSTTYGGERGIRASFERILSLPPASSDNIGRVRFVTEFCSRYWPSVRFTSRKPRVLDVGAGLGVFPYEMKRSGWDCTALEMDERYVAHHRANIGIESIRADIRDPLHIAPFDLITFNKVLEHVPDAAAVLASSARLLLPEGLVYVEVPDGEAADAEGKEREEFLLGHIHVFSFASYALLGARARMQVLSCERLREPSTKFTLRGFVRPVQTHAEESI